MAAHEVMDLLMRTRSNDWRGRAPASDG